MSPASPGARRRVLLVGASGVFGGRLARMLATRADIELVLAARRLEPLEALATELRGARAAARIDVAVFDREQPRALKALAPFLVIDAAGPFQGQDAAFPTAVLQAGAHYLDLADARDFVAAFPERLRDHSAAAGRWAITGASSTPALTCAAVDQLTYGWTRIDRIEAAISPGARAPRGLSVVRAILRWTGAPVHVLADGIEADRPGWSRPRRLAFPGLGRRWMGLAETPDLDQLRQRYAPTRDALFSAGLELPPLHLGLWLLSLLRRWRLVATLEPLAPLLNAAAGLLAPLGSDRGGMTVRVEGLDADSAPTAARWSLWAERGAGPNVPAAPAAATAAALLDDVLGPPRASVCVGVVPLPSLLAPLASLPIRTRIDHAAPQAAGVFPKALGRSFAILPQTLRAAHSGDAPVELEGRARSRGAGGLAALVRALQGLPRPGAHAAAVSITPEPSGGETWSRRFDGRLFRSRIRPVPDDPFAFEETVGPLTFRFHAAPYPGGFSWNFESWRMGPLPLPAAWAPRTRARTFERDGSYGFRVLVAHPWLGVIFAYAGRLRPAP
jgi:saccharopine dehydrogenase-like NADP-dependent oxidoreductase